MEHIETPFEQGPVNKENVYDGHGNLLFTCRDEQHAAFIVKACNYHKTLIEAVANAISDNLCIDAAQTLLNEIKGE